MALMAVSYRPVPTDCNRPLWKAFHKSRYLPVANGRNRPILLKKSVLAGATFPELKKCTIWALLRKNQDGSLPLSEPDFNVAHALS
jgi:hypothetical protein